MSKDLSERAYGKPRSMAGSSSPAITTTFCFVKMLQRPPDTTRTAAKCISILIPLPFVVILYKFNKIIQTHCFAAVPFQGGRTKGRRPAITCQPPSQYIILLTASGQERDLVIVVVLLGH